jgi:hypothetical protein
VKNISKIIPKNFFSPSENMINIPVVSKNLEEFKEKPE